MIYINILTKVIDPKFKIHIVTVERNTMTKIYSLITMDIEVATKILDPKFKIHI